MSIIYSVYLVLAECHKILTFIECTLHSYSRSRTEKGKVESFEAPLPTGLAVTAGRIHLIPHEMLVCEKVYILPLLLHVNSANVSGLRRRTAQEVQRSGLFKGS